VDGVTVTQPDDGGAVAVGALVSVDGRPGYGVQLGPGAVRIPVPPQQASTVRLTLTAVRGEGPVRIQDVAVSGPRVRRPAAAPGTGQGPAPCLQVAGLDGAPLLVRPTRPVSELAAGAAVPFTGCGGPLTLSAGRHRLRPQAAWALDDLVLRDQLGVAPRAAPATSVEVIEHGDTRTVARTSAAGAPYWLVAGRGLDPAWSARADGADLGPPVLVDGYSAGWLILDGGSHRVDITYTPQGRAIMARAASVAAALGCVGLVVWPVVHRRRRPSPAAVAGKESATDGH
jgi:arabinofuranan 3-O-arabinosyltransferase